MSGNEMLLAAIGLVVAVLVREVVGWLKSRNGGGDKPLAAVEQLAKAVAGHDLPGIVRRLDSLTDELRNLRNRLAERLDGDLARVLARLRELEKRVDTLEN
jgi:hypothetical protein